MTLPQPMLPSDPSDPMQGAIAASAVRLVSDPAHSDSTTAFLRAVHEARSHLENGARSIVFVVPAQGPQSDTLYRSLASFARHADRVCPGRRAQMSAVLIPNHHPSHS